MREHDKSWAVSVSAHDKSWAIPEPPPLEPAISGLDYEALQKCIHCGFCIESCPTYRQTRLEIASPRGRIALIRALAEGRLPVTDTLADALDLCLGCRACETACPNGMPYGRLLEDARAVVRAVIPAPWYVRFALRHLMPYIGRLRLLARLARWVRPLGAFRLLPKELRELAEALPPLTPHKPYGRGGGGAAGATGVAGGATPHKPYGGGATAPPEAVRPKLLYFRGCVQEAFLQPQNHAAVAVLEAAGAHVTVIEAQTCCGALSAHYGDREGARRLARRNIAAFEQHEGLIINHAGGCGAQLKEYAHLLGDDPAWADRARAFVARVRDLSEWLVEQQLPPGSLHPVDLRVTYQDSCHLAHGQKIRSQPRMLIRAVPGIEYREMAGADQCCGSAGIYNMVQPEMSGRVLGEKMSHVEATQAGAIVCANPGCYLQLRQGVNRRGLEGQVEVLSLAELLLRSIQSEEKRA